MNHETAPTVQHPEKTKSRLPTGRGRRRFSFSAGLMGLALGAMLSLPARRARAQEAAPETPTRDVFIQVLDSLQQQGLEVDLQTAERATVEALVKAADPLGRIVTQADRDQFQREAQGLFYAVGLRLTMTNGLPRVQEVLENGPARDTALKAGDLVTRIDKRDLGRTDIATVTALLRSPDGETVSLTAVTPLGETNVVEVRKEYIPLPAVEAADALPSDLCYIRVNGIRKGVAAEVMAILRGWNQDGRFGAVVDLRGANGTDVEGAAELAGLFGEPGSLLFSFRDGADQDVQVFKAPPGTPLGMPTMVLTDERTSGAAEVLAASLKRSIRGAMLLGATTSGDPAIREVVNLSPDYAAYVATRRLVTADGTVYTGREGVKPDILIAKTPTADYDFEPEPTGRKRETLEEEIEDRMLRARVRGDAALDRAVNILLGLKALNIRGIHHYSQATPG